MKAMNGAIDFLGISGNTGFARAAQSRWRSRP